MLTNTDDLVGTRVGSCTLERLLSVGGMSAVYLARQERPRRQVAVKLLRAASAPSAATWERTLARFRQEADAAAALDHANIVPIYEFGAESAEEGEIAYLVMPYLADGSLAALLARQGPLSVPQAIVYLEQAAAALDYAHQAGIVHRDVKLSNLLLHPDGRLLLADFGIARALHGPRDADLTISGVATGTPEYMAPEQVRGETVGPAADIYALGVVAYALLAGHTPYETLIPVSMPGQSTDAQAQMRSVLARQLTEPAPPLRTKRAGVSPRLEETIFWALAKEPADRPPTAGAFVRAARESSRSRALSVFFSKADALLTSGFASSLPRFETPTSLPPVGVPPAPVTPRVDRYSSSDVTPAGGAAPPPVASASMEGPDAPTIHELPLLAQRPAPEWPSSTRGPDEQRPLSLTKVLLIVATALVGCALLAGGAGAIGYVLSGANPLSSLPAVATSHPTITPLPTATALPAVILSASPASVTLACRSGKRAPTVTLTNTGQGTAQWSATQEGPQIFVNPLSGTLNPGRRQTITLTSYSLFSQDGQGTLRFTADGAADGASVSYTLQSCLRSSGDNGDGVNADSAQISQGVAARNTVSGSGHKKKHGGG
jgi:serine/threonine protein kinase